jgi:hypothetical protein
MPHAVAEQLTDEQFSIIPARMLRTENSPHRPAGNPHPLQPPSRSLEPPAQPSAHPPSPSRQETLNRRMDTTMDARLDGTRQAWTRRQHLGQSAHCPTGGPMSLRAGTTRR